MIKGCSRRMIVLKDTGSDFFEEAYFVIKSHKVTGKIRTERDFVAEANRIVNEAAEHGVYADNKDRKKKPLIFLFGVLFGIIISAACVLFIKFVL